MYFTDYHDSDLVATFERVDSEVKKAVSVERLSLDILEINEKIHNVSLESLENVYVKKALFTRLNKIQEAFEEMGIRVEPSVENIGSIIIAAGRKIIEKIKQFGEWIWNKLTSLFNRGKTDKSTIDKLNRDINEAAKKAAAVDKSYQQSAAKPVKKDEPVEPPPPPPPTHYTFRTPKNVFFAFHTSNFVPKPDYKFNSSNIINMAVKVTEDFRVVNEAFYDQIETLIELAKELLSYIKKETWQSAPDMKALRRRGKLGQFADGKFSFIGVEFTDIQADKGNWYRKTNVDLKPATAMAAIRSATEGPEVTITVSSVQEITRVLSDRSKENTDVFDRVRGMFERNNIRKELKEFKIEWVTVRDNPKFREYDTIEYRQRERQHQVNSLLDTVTAMYILVDKYGSAIENHTLALTQLLTAINNAQKVLTNDTLQSN